MKFPTNKKEKTESGKQRMRERVTRKLHPTEMRKSMYSACVRHWVPRDIGYGVGGLPWPIYIRLRFCWDVWVC
jgi:hypothetical protein